MTLSSKHAHSSGVPLLRCFQSFPFVDNWQAAGTVPQSDVARSHNAATAMDRVEEFKKMQELRKDLERARQIADMARRRCV